MLSSTVCMMARVCSTCAQARDSALSRGCTSFMSQAGATGARGRRSIPSRFRAGRPSGHSRVQDRNGAHYGRLVRIVRLADMRAGGRCGRAARRQARPPTTLDGLTARGAKLPQVGVGCGGLMGRLARVAAAACLAGSLAACAVVDPVDSRYDTISRSLAKARNESILLNLARASHDHPLNFVTIANVSPSMSNVTSFGLPTFLLGRSMSATTEPTFSPGRFAVINNTTASNATSVSTNFSVSTQETSVFYTGFLKPLDLLTVDYFIRQGYSRELLFWLFTQSVEVEGGIPHPLLFRYQPPVDYGCPRADPQKKCFEEFILIAMVTGLTIEQRAVQRPASNRGGGNRGNAGGGNRGDSTGGGGNKPETISFFRFCFDPLLAERAVNDLGPELKAEAKHYMDPRVTAAQLKPRCGTEWDPRNEENKPQKDTFEFNRSEERRVGKECRSR